MLQTLMDVQHYCMLQGKGNNEQSHCYWIMEPIVKLGKLHYNNNNGVDSNNNILPVG